MFPAPVVFFVYNRPWHTVRTVESLMRNSLAPESNLHIFSDGPKNQQDAVRVQEVREYLQDIDGFARVHITEQTQNLGLAASIISGVTGAIERFGTAIVLEDDIVSSPNFLEFMNQALKFYENNPMIFSISGYSFPVRIPSSYPWPVYLSPRCSSWGWGTWKDRWEKVDWLVRDYPEFLCDQVAQQAFNRGGEDMTRHLTYQMEGKIQAWGARFCYAHFRHHAYCLMPVVSKIRNIGVDGSGTHRENTNRYDVALDRGAGPIEFPSSLEENDEIVRSLHAIFSDPVHGYFLGTLKRILRLR